MRARWIATLSAALVLCLQADAAAYCLNVPPALGKPIAWQTIPVTYRVSDNLTDSAILAAIDAAFNTWGSVQCSTLKFTKGAQFKMCTETDKAKCAAGTVHFEHGTPYLFVFWYDSSNSSAFPTSSTSAAYNYLWYGMIGSISAASLAINAFQYKWDGNGGDTTTFDTQSEIMPLIGAVIGLTESKTAGSVMYPGMAYGDTTKRTLTQDDKDGLVYLYQDSSCAAPPPPDPSCGTVVPPTDGGGTTTGDGGGTTTGDGGGTTTGDGGGTTTGDGGGTTTGDGGGTTTGDGGGTTTGDGGGGGGGDDDGCGCVIGDGGRGGHLRTGALLLLLCLGLVLGVRRRS